jgi:DNA-binding NarL/FixJ family response regulator
MKQNTFEFLIPPTFLERAKAARLTPREIEVAELLASGESWKSAADSLNMSIRTLEKHVQRIHLKLGFESTVQCVIFLISPSLSSQ